MLSKEKRNKLLAGVVTLSMVTMMAGCGSDVPEQNSDWNGQQAQEDDSSFWSNIASFGAGAVLGNMMGRNSVDREEEETRRHTTSTYVPANNLRSGTAAGTTTNVVPASTTKTTTTAPAVKQAAPTTSSTSSKVAAPSSAKSGIGTGAARSSVSAAS